MIHYAHLTDEQLAELEKQLAAAEKELADQIHMKVIFTGEATKNIEFKACEYLRRLLEDVKSYKIKVADD